MIKYYAYYNHGGYKDFYLGCNEDEVDSRYFLPLLPIYENDESMSDKVAEWKQLPSIINLSSETLEYNYPSKARVMMSHAGYKMQCRIIDGKFIFAIRDIVGNKDSSGRSCPFVMMLVADTEEDRNILETLAYYVWKNNVESQNFICSIFVNDFKVNGLRFDVRKFTNWINDVKDRLDISIEENVYKRSVPIFIVPDGLRFRNAFEEQQLSVDDVAVAHDESNTSHYYYKPSQVAPGPVGCTPAISTPFGERDVTVNSHESKHHSFRNTLGFAKAEDLQNLIEAHQKLEKKVSELEQRIAELENKQI